MKRLLFKRDNEAFNFHQKGDNLLDLGNNNLYDNLERIIKERNDEIKNLVEKNKDEIEKYFLIIKTRIPLFEGEYEKYGELIDFLDIPGIDEKEKFNFDNFIKPIFKNILFPIFIYDIDTYNHDGPKNIFIDFIGEYFKSIKSKYILENINNIRSFNKGFYILNKIDKKNDEEEKK